MKMSQCLKREWNAIILPTLTCTLHLWISLFDAPTFAKKANEALLMF